tara:strand:+ start:89 stop:1066 length:978 start_codon:yes stop_codon:yes gene_type:complete
MSEEPTAESPTTEQAFEAHLQGKSPAQVVEEAQAQPAEVPEEPPEEPEEAPEEEPEEAEPEEEEALVAADKYVLPLGEGGENIEVEADEVKNLILRQKDYTQKTQSLAETRKQLDAERNSIRAIQQIGSELQQEYEALRKTEELEVDQEYWDRLKTDNPMQYMIEKQDLQERNLERGKSQAKLNSLHQQMQNQQQLEFNQRLAEEQLKLAEAIPEWQDQQRAQEERTQLRAYGLSMGFSEKELSEVYDSRAVRVLRSAMKWEDLQSKKGSLKRKALQVPASAGATLAQANPRRKHTELTKAKQRLAKSGKRTDATAAFQLMLDRS